MFNKLNKVKIHFDKVNIIAGTIVSWGALGFYRGFNEPDYEYQHKKSINQPFMYSKEFIIYFKKIGNGLLWSGMYINPIIFFLIFPKEIYRLEVDIRGLEDEKKTEAYKRLF